MRKGLHPHCGSFLKRKKRANAVSFCYNYALCFIFLFPLNIHPTPPFHRDADENLMKPGTVGAPPGDLRVEYFNCTFTPSVCLQRRRCSRIRRTVSHKLTALLAAVSQPFILSSVGSFSPRQKNATEIKKKAVRWLVECWRGNRLLILSPISCCLCNINQPSIVISLLSVFQILIDGAAFGWLEGGLWDTFWSRMACKGRETRACVCQWDNSISHCVSPSI